MCGLLPTYACVLFLGSLLPCIDGYVGVLRLLAACAQTSLLVVLYDVHLSVVAMRKYASLSEVWKICRTIVGRHSQLLVEAAMRVLAVLSEVCPHAHVIQKATPLAVANRTAPLLQHSCSFLGHCIGRASKQWRGSPCLASFPVWVNYSSHFLSRNGHNLPVPNPRKTSTKETVQPKKFQPEISVKTLSKPQELSRKPSNPHGLSPSKPNNLLPVSTVPRGAPQGTNTKTVAFYCVAGH